MGKIKLLDCTLRDGGYLNDWNFGHEDMVSVFERVVQAGTDIIEVGFLDDRRQFDINRSIFPDTDCAEKIYGGLDRRDTMVFGMIDYGTCGIANIKPESESFLDGIRVIFKKHLRKEALAFCAELKKLGYIVFAQLVSVTAYSEDELKDLCRLANEVRPDAVSMVDTYGLTHQSDLKNMLSILDENLAEGVAIGYHGHNNFQMAYANCQTVLAYSKETSRDILVDGTLYGMGKSAGNAPIELVAMHMNHEYGRTYNISHYLEAIDSSILKYTQDGTWGYSLFYFLAASNDCHPSYVKQLMNKHTLSIMQINELLGRLEGEKKLLYDASYMEELYVSYQDREINDDEDMEELSALFRDRTVMVFGPGRSIASEADIIKERMIAEAPYTIAINYRPGALKTDMIFLTNAKRCIQMSSFLNRRDCLITATSNVTPPAERFEHTVNISSLLDRESEYPDNSLVMLIKLLIRTGTEKVLLAGFDGYSGTDANYLDEGKEYSFAKQKADYLNSYMSGFLRSIKDKVDIEFVTETKYKV